MASSLTKHQEKLILDLFDYGMVKFGSFRFKFHEKDPNIPLAPFYIDLRMVRRFPEVRKDVINVYIDLLKNIKFDLIADVPTAATPIVAILSHKLNAPMITPRSDSKTHGSGAKIDGAIEEDIGKVAVLVDDLITRADSKFEAIAVLAHFGINVKDVVVLIDREQGGEKELASAGYNLHFAFTLSQMLEFYKDTGRMDEKLYKQTLEKLFAMNSYLGIKN